MITIRGRWFGAAAVMLGLVGWGFGSPLLLGWAAGLAAMLVVAISWIAAQPSVSAFQVLSPGSVEVGEPASAVVTISNKGSRRTVPLVVSNPIGKRRAEEMVPGIAKNDRTTAHMELPTDRRGIFEVGPLRIAAADPLYLAERVTHRGAGLHLTVYPRIVEMSALPTGHRRELEGVGQRPQEGGVVFHSLRDYEDGDDLRLIHWRSVARTGQLMVRRNVITTEPRLMVVLDTAAGSYRSDEHFEAAVEIAASLVAAGCSSNYPMFFRTTAGDRADAGPGGDGQDQIMRILAGVRSSDEDPGLSSLLSLGERTNGVSLGVVSSMPTLEETAAVSFVRSQFDMVTVLHVGRDDRPLAIAGSSVIWGNTSDDVATRWRARFT